jgi:tRNA threonylcarbamoyladenosine biosynthesis protein TsaB
VALVRGDEVMLAESFTAERTHNSRLFGPIERALSLARPDLIVIGTGPGSYTGVRVSLAAAVGLSLAWQVPVMGLSSLLAWETDEVMPAIYQIIGDARRGQFFTATVQDEAFVQEPQLSTWDDLVATWSLPGEKPPRVTFDEKPLADISVLRGQPSAKKLARLAQQLSPEEIAAQAKKTPEPYYLSAPFITEAKKRR